MRLFTAITFKDCTKKQIAQVQSRLKAYSDGRFTAYENLHLTVVFIGETDPKDLIKIKHTLQSIRPPETKLVFSHTGCFKKREGDIWWIGAEPSSALVALHKALTASFINLGFELEQRPYTPHITLARKVKPNKCISSDMLMDAPFSANISSFSLMLSERRNGKLVYTELLKISAK